LPGEGKIVRFQPGQFAKYGKGKADAAQVLQPLDSRGDQVVYFVLNRFRLVREIQDMGIEVGFEAHKKHGPFRDFVFCSGVFKLHDYKEDFIFCQIQWGVPSKNLTSCQQ